MPNLPPSTDFTDSSVTEGLFKTAITNQREYLASLLGTDGLKQTALATLGALFGSLTTKNSNYTIIASDNGKVIQATSTFTLSLTAAATLGSSFSFVLNNVGTGNITIDPSGSQTIDGNLTKVISGGQSAIVYCDGTNFYTVGSAGVISLNGQTGDITNTNLYAIGSYVTGRPNNQTNYGVNSTIAGSSLYATIPGTAYNGSSWLFGSTNVSSSITLVNTGTWRCVSPAFAFSGATAYNGLWVRIS